MSYNQNSGYGQAFLNAVRAAVPGFGKIFIVTSSTDTASEDRIQRLIDVFPPDPNGAVRFYTSLETAYAATTSNNHDVIVLDGDTTHTVSAIMNVSKNRVHFVGLDYLMGLKRAYGQSTKVSMGVTTAATDLGVINNTGVRNSFRGIKFISNNTKAESLYCFLDGGEYTYIDSCEFYKSTDLDVTGAAEFVCNADSPNYLNCTFGSLADARSGAVIRAALLFTKGLSASGKVTRDALFKDCNLWIQCTNTANRFAYGANATDIERTCVMENCNFICNGASTAVPAQNIAFGASLTVGNVLLKRCSSVEAGTAMSTTTGVFVDGGPPTAATTGISVQAA
jgi:hypothetical protein